MREILNSELDRFFRHHVHDHVSTVLRGDGQGHFTNVFMRPIPLAPGSSKIIYGIVAAGTPDEVAAELKQITLPPAELEQRYQARREGAVTLASVPAGEPYRFSQKRMAAVALTNLVFSGLHQAALCAALLARQMVGQPLHLGLGLHRHRPGATRRRAAPLTASTPTPPNPATPKPLSSSTAPPCRCSITSSSNSGT